MKSLISEAIKFVKGLAPAADRWNTDPATDVVNAALYGRVAFLVTQEGGTTGKATLTVQACTAADGTGATAVAYKYRVGAAGAGAGGDAFGSITDATSSGFDTTPATDRQYLCEIDASTLPVGYNYVRLKCTEAANDPVNGCVSILLGEPRFGGSSLPSAIV